MSGGQRRAATEQRRRRAAGAGAGFLTVGVAVGLAANLFAPSLFCTLAARRLCGRRPKVDPNVVSHKVLAQTRVDATGVKTLFVITKTARENGPFANRFEECRQ
jgi:hypothetical protein